MYKRILLKLSGEILQNQAGFGLEKSQVDQIVSTLIKINKTKTQIAIVLGAGNYWRYRDTKTLEIERTKSDLIGMLATIINCQAISSTLEKAGLKTSIYSAIQVDKLTKPFDSIQAKKDLEKGKIVFLAGGTGNPFFTTDSAAALRALELECDILLKATKVDGVYDSDPVKNPNAQKFTQLTYQEVLEKNLQVMDLTAISLCKENKMPLRVFNMLQPENLQKIIQGEEIGTYIN